MLQEEEADLQEAITLRTQRSVGVSVMDTVLSGLLHGSYPTTD